MKKTIISQKKKICKGCNHAIAEATYKKYGGYSAQCLAKKEAFEQAQMMPPTLQERQRFLTHVDPYLIKKMSVQQINLETVYTRRQYAYIYGITDNLDYYYNRYLQKTLFKLIKVLEQDLVLEESLQTKF